MFEIASLSLIVILFAIFIAGVVFLIQGAPYVPSDDESARQIIKMVEYYKPKHILDMGSGDGKLVILLAKQGYEVDGVELNPLLVFRSRKAIRKAGLQDKATIKWKNFWNMDISQYDLVVLYAIKHIMAKLEKKLISELRPGSHIVSNFFEFPTLKTIKKTSRAKVYKTS